MLENKREYDDELGGPRISLDISQSITISPQEPKVQLMVGNELIYFLVDTRAT